jgi:hypothetical protein
MFGSLVMIIAAAMEPAVAATFSHSAAQREGIVAEQIMLPKTISAMTFADELVAAEGLTSWSPQDPTSSLPGEPLQWRARHASNGREVTVYFAPDKQSVCRVRRPRGGLSDGHWQAIRWCAASLGIVLPFKRQPPVRTD